jgi:hypothetical protein
MRHAINFLMLAMGVALGLAGCKSSESPIFFTSPSSPFSDVPVPISFTLESKTGSSQAPDGGRYMDHVYQSKDASEPVVDFFSKQLPKNGWVLQGQDRGAGLVLLKYAKGGEVLQIEVTSGTMIRTNVRLHISPAAAK